VPSGVGVRFPLPACLSISPATGLSGFIKSNEDEVQITIKELEAAKVEMTVVIPSAEVEKSVQGKLKEYGRKAQFKGFRKGKAPISLIQKVYGEQARGEALNDLLNRSYPEALAQEDLRPIEQGSIEKMDHEPGGDLSYVAHVEIEPRLKAAGYEGIEVRRAPREVTDEDLGSALEQLRRQYANWAPVEGDGAADGDQLTCDIQETDEAGADLEDRLYKSIQVELGKAAYGPQFDEKMAGATAGETRSFEVKNDENDPDPDIAGKIEYYRVTVHELKRPELAELDDEFAKEVPPGFDTLDELKVKVREDLDKQLANALKQQENNLLIEKIIEANPVELPEKMIEDQLDAIIRQAKAGTSNPIDESIVRKSYRDQVTRNLHWSMVARSIVRQEGVKVEDADMDQEIGRFAAQMGQDPASARLQLKRMGALDRLRDEVMDRKLMDFLREKNTFAVDESAPAMEEESSEA
jgi:trigger factor